jgi:hypothetical protein
LYCRLRSLAVSEQRVLPTMQPSGFSIGTIWGRSYKKITDVKLVGHTNV